MNTLIIAIFEGLSTKYLPAWMEKGYLPNFIRLAKEGFLQEFQCNPISYEAAGLITAFSGQSINEHGVLSYYQAHNSDYIPQVWDSSKIKDRMLWTNAALDDVEFNVINVFGTHPVYKITGNMISYLVKHSLHACYPSSFISLLKKEGIIYRQDLNGFRLSREDGSYQNEVLQADDGKLQTLKYLLSHQGKNSVHVINFTGIDRLSHFCMNELLLKDVNWQETAVFQAYKNCDRILGELLNFANNSNTELLMFSEIGFGHLQNYVSVNEYLHHKKFLKWGDTPRRPEWKQTLAFESPQGTSGININRKSLYRDGIVSDEDAPKLIEQVINQIKQMPNPYTGTPMFKAVLTREEFYGGNTDTPDIILLPYDEQYLPYGDSYWADIVSRFQHTGWHRSTSYWGGYGSKVIPIMQNSFPSLLSIKPIIYKFIGR